jgi:ATPase inhibitor, mitochondrial
MLRTQAIKLARATPTLHRTFLTTAIRAAEGDTGATRSGGVKSSDSFNKREAAEESRYIRQKELDAYV